MIRAKKIRRVTRTYTKRDHEFWARGIKKKAARAAATARSKRGSLVVYTPPATKISSRARIIPTATVHEGIRTTRRREVTMTFHVVEFSEG